MRYFNTAGPCDEVRHYMVPAEPRLPDARRLIDQGQYFVVHAPRQTGKTTTLRSLAHTLTAEGKYAALHFSCEAGEAMGEDVEAVEAILLHRISNQAGLDLPAELAPPVRSSSAPAGERLADLLQVWAQACPRPLVLFFDEIDALQGDSLRTVLRQLRAGFPNRPGAFPHSVVLCGLRDVRDYKAASGGNPDRLGTSSPFNIKVESLKLGSFTEPQVTDLLRQHTEQTGQPFAPKALEQVWALTQGQPWLVNALAREIVEKIQVPLADTITLKHVDAAKERLILARATHLDSLVARLDEPRVRKILEPILSGDLPETEGTFDDDLLYVRDLGLVAANNPIRPANPIYREVIARVLSHGLQASIPLDRPSYVDATGRLDLRLILEEFAAFWRLHGEQLIQRKSYHEVAPHLVLMAFLQRVVNGGGIVDREYGVGRGRLDILVRWPLGVGQTEQKEALELKVWRPKKADPLVEGLVQLDGYLDRLGLDQGTLVIFDRRPEAPVWEERTNFTQVSSPRGRSVLLLRA